MTLSELTASERHRRISGGFTDLAQRITDWDVPAPVAGWTARDVVKHLVTCPGREPPAGVLPQLLAGMEPMEEAIRSSGHYGPKVEVPADADPQARLIGFIGRNPAA